MGMSLLTALSSQALVNTFNLISKCSTGSLELLEITDNSKQNEGSEYYISYNDLYMRYRCEPE